MTVTLEALDRTAAEFRFRWLIAGFLVAGAALALPLDVLLARFFMSDPFPGEIRSLIHKTEFFGHAYGIGGIAFTIYLICDNRRRRLPRLLVTAFSAGILCDLVKMVIHRVRPVDFSFGDGAATFQGISFLHVETLKQVFDSSYHSFPSAHTATAVAFAMGLGALFPQGARWFLTLAGMVAVSRFDGGAHFVSDTFAGALLGYASGCWMLGPSSISDWFADYETGRRTALWASSRTSDAADAPGVILVGDRQATPKPKPLARPRHRRPTVPVGRSSGRIDVSH